MLFLTLQVALSSLSFIYKSPMIIPEIESIPAFETSSKSLLDLGVAMSKDGQIAGALGPAKFKILQAVSLHLDGNDSALILLAELEEILRIPRVESIIQSYPEYPLAVVATKLLAISITEDFRRADMTAENWKGLLAVTRMQTRVDYRNMAFLKKECTVICGMKNEEGNKYQNNVTNDFTELRNCVSGLVPNSTSTALAYLQMGFILQMPSLMKSSADLLNEALSMDNVVKIFQAAVNTETTNLKNKAEEFILLEFEEISKHHDDFPNLNVDELLSLIISDKIKVSTEGSIFQAIVRWVEDDLETRKSHVATLLNAVRLHLCSLSELNEMSDNFLLDGLESVQMSIRSAIYTISLNSQQLPALIKKERRNLHETFFIVSGYTANNSYAATVETFSVSEKQWIGQEELDYGPLVLNHAVAVGNKIFVFTHNQYNVSSFDAIKKEWEFRSTVSNSRKYYGVTVHNSLIYVLSGWVDAVATNISESYNPETDVWTELPSLNHPRYATSAATLKGKIYLAGGHNGSQIVSTVEVFDSNSSHWDYIQPMKTARQYFPLVSDGNKLWAFGGHTGSENMNNVESYDPDSDTWTDIPPLISPRHYHAAAYFNGDLYVLGGVGVATHQTSVQVYNPRKNLWTTAPDLKYGRQNLGACVLQNLPNAADYISYE